MYWENGRIFVQGIMLLVFAVIAGLALVAFIGVIKLQEVSLGSPLEADGLEEAANQKIEGTDRLMVQR